jgi:hypothetical protein
MQKWEYLVIVLEGSNVRFDPRIYSINGELVKEDKLFHPSLNELGKEGWEMTGIRGDVYYFKRPIE